MSTKPYARQPQSDDPVWLQKAFGEIGVRELSGAATNAPRILTYHSCTGLGATDDETPWCSSFMCWVMEQSGFTSTRSAASLSWLRWGRELDAPVRGCVVIYERVDRNGAIIPNRGHVGLWLGENGTVTHTLGGNQRDQVGINSYMTDRVVGYRWPAMATNSTTNVASVATGTGAVVASAPTIMGLLGQVGESESSLTSAVDTAKNVAGGLGMHLTNGAACMGLLVALAGLIYIVRERNKKIKKFGI